MKPETERILQLADAYADAFDRKWGKARCDLQAAIEQLVADRDTLAAGVMDLVGCSAVRLDGIHVIQAAIAVAERIKAASEPAKPPAVPAEPASAIAVADQATEEWQWRDAEDRATQPEPSKPPAEPEYDLVEVGPDGEAWRYQCGQHHGEHTDSFPDNWVASDCPRALPAAPGARRFRSMPAALAWWRETHPEPTKNAEPADISTLAGKVDEMIDRLNEMTRSDEYGGHPTHCAVVAIARVVEALAKEAE